MLPSPFFSDLSGQTWPRGVSSLSPSALSLSSYPSCWGADPEWSFSSMFSFSHSSEAAVTFPLISAFAEHFPRHEVIKNCLAGGGNLGTRWVKPAAMCSVSIPEHPRLALVQVPAAPPHSAPCQCSRGHRGGWPRC